MMQLAQIADHLQRLAPLSLGETWDNVGLLVGRPTHAVRAIMTCLTITPASAAEAIREKADLIVTHHPLPFQPLRRLTHDSVAGRMLLDLIEARVAIYSPHTAFDSAANGINQQLAELLELRNIVPLTPQETEPAIGTGRWGTLSEPLLPADVAARLKQRLKIPFVQLVQLATEQPVTRVAVGCGSAGSLLAAAMTHNCQLFVTGEASFHRCLEAQAEGVSLVLLGHYASERFGVERLAEQLQASFPQLRVWASRDEQDPLRWL